MGQVYVHHAHARLPTTAHRRSRTVSTQRSGTHALYVLPSAYVASLRFTHALSLTGHTPPARTHVPPPAHQRKPRAVAPGNRGSGPPGGSAAHDHRTGAGDVVPPPPPSSARFQHGREAPSAAQPLALWRLGATSGPKRTPQPGSPGTGGAAGRGQRRDRPSAEQRRRRRARTGSFAGAPAAGQLPRRAGSGRRPASGPRLQ